MIDDPSATPPLSEKTIEYLLRWKVAFVAKWERDKNGKAVAVPDEVHTYRPLQIAG